MAPRIPSLCFNLPDLQSLSPPVSETTVLYLQPPRPCSMIQNVPLGKSLGDDRAHFICLSSLRNHNPVLLLVQHQKTGVSNFLYSFWLFTVAG